MFTWIIIGATVLVSWLAFNDRRLMDRLILWPPAIDKSKQYDRLLTYGFLHADFAHLLFNMVTLYFFGRYIEAVMSRWSGPWVFPLFYLSALVVSILPSYLKNQHNPRYYSLGASGAVSAVLFAFILLQPWTWIFVFFIPVPAIVYAVAYVAYSIWMDRKGGDHINHSAHLAGAAYGVMFMLIMRPDVLGHFLNAVANPGFPR
ncbi:rhomboid family intramembrane serine protease [Pseudoxanthomonas kalamensis DSM 18571]|uniref:rhomboid family intramembrane serine protease n=1 Tax=Pseudoxanthomonas kalamensis TaxID=289483 RepID=UPI0013913594|nr:rhomboid family intramembrane serine protease [Pseudoxanthomonas kalamensis]KAF1710694.1 rhomboid family intramembrane serine protease [Pseudoxanthomonas kalamensis DSM 18571]